MEMSLLTGLNFGPSRLTRWEAARRGPCWRLHRLVREGKPGRRILDRNFALCKHLLNELVPGLLLIRLEEFVGFEDLRLRLLVIRRVHDELGRERLLLGQAERCRVRFKDRNGVRG